MPSISMAQLKRDLRRVPLENGNEEVKICQK